MLKRLRENHPILYCAASEALFLVTITVISSLLVMLMLFAGVGYEDIDYNLLSALQEAAGALVAVLLLRKTGRLELLQRRGSGFFNGLLVGMYPLAIILYNAYAKLLFGLPENGSMLPISSILTFFAYMTLVGVAEELLFRGVIAETLLEHFGTTRAGVWKACIVSGLFFGAAHLLNLWGSAAFGVLMQCVFSASLGILFAAIYFRTGNIWVTTFLHAAMDAASLLVGGLYGTETVADTISTYDATLLLSIAIYVLPVFFLLRKKKLGEVALYFGKECQKQVDEV